MVLDENGEISTEPYIPTSVTKDPEDDTKAILTIALTGEQDSLNGREGNYTPDSYDEETEKASLFKTGGVVLVDYYIEKTYRREMLL